MSKSLCVLAFLSAVALAAPAGASINYNASKSNTGNFAAECRKAGGALSNPNGQPTCTIQKDVDVSSPMLAACTKDGGRPVVKHGEVTCSGMPVGRRQH
jgi:hypothetical protein